MSDVKPAEFAQTILDSDPRGWSKPIRDLAHFALAEKARADELQGEFSANVDHLDLMVDEFGRIRALMMGGHPAIAEVQQLCERAIEQTKQRVPVIKQRDKLVRLVNEKDGRIAALEAENTQLLSPITTTEGGKRTIDRVAEIARENEDLTMRIAALEAALTQAAQREVTFRERIAALVEKAKGQTRFCPECERREKRIAELEAEKTTARRDAFLEAKRWLEEIADWADRETHGVDSAIPGLRCAATEIGLRLDGA